MKIKLLLSFLSICFIASTITLHCVITGWEQEIENKDALKDFFIYVGYPLFIFFEVIF